MYLFYICNIIYYIVALCIICFMFYKLKDIGCNVEIVTKMHYRAFRAAGYC